MHFTLFYGGITLNTAQGESHFELSERVDVTYFMHNTNLLCFTPGFLCSIYRSCCKNVLSFLCFSSLSGVL